MEVGTNKIYHELLAFIEEQRGKYKASISLHTQIEKDLGIYGDDAEDFLLAYAYKFNVDIQQFSFEKYFSHETNNLFTLFSKKFGFIQQKKQKELTIQDLLNGIITKKLQ